MRPVAAKEERAETPRVRAQRAAIEKKAQDDEEAEEKWGAMRALAQPLMFTSAAAPSMSNTYSAASLMLNNGNG